MNKLLIVLFMLTLLVTGCDKGSKTASEEVTSAKVAANDTISNKPMDDKKESYKLYKETKHFRIYCLEQDKGCLKDLGDGLEAAYSKVTADLACKLDYRVDVMVYPNIESYQNALGFESNSIADSYNTASTIGKKIYITSPLNPGPVRTYEHMVKSSALHEFTHVVINEITSSDTWPANVPRWLNEGVASYEGGAPMPESIMIDKVSASVYHDQVPSFKELASYGRDFNEIGGYFFTLPAGKFFIEKYGFEKVKQLILSPGHYESIFGKSEQEIWNEWVEFLKKNYINKFVNNEKSL